MKIWPWSTIARQKKAADDLVVQLLAVEFHRDQWQRRATSAENKISEMNMAEKALSKDLAEDGSVRPGSPLARKLTKLQERARFYRTPPPEPLHAPKPRKVAEEPERRHQDSGSDSMAGILGLMVATESSRSFTEPESPPSSGFKSGGGDYGGGGASGSWDSSSSSPSSSDSSSSSSDSGSSSSCSSSD